MDHRASGWRRSPSSQPDGLGGLRLYASNEDGRAEVLRQPDMTRPQGRGQHAGRSDLLVMKTRQFDHPPLHANDLLAPGRSFPYQVFKACL